MRAFRIFLRQEAYVWQWRAGKWYYWYGTFALRLARDVVPVLATFYTRLYYGNWVIVNGILNFIDVALTQGH